MAFERRERPDNAISLFKNDERRNEKDPIYKGQGKVNGREYWVSGWINESRKDGSKYMSIKLKPKEEQRRETYNREREETTYRPSSQPPFDDDVPFAPETR